MSRLDAVAGQGLDPRLRELVRLHASTINGCAYCVDMHTQEARHAGETEQRLYAIPVWHETPFFTPRERAALLWTETLVNLPQRGVPDDVFNAVRAEFDEKEIISLTMAVNAINAWNRFGVAFQLEPGHYTPAAHTVPSTPTAV
jgi:AhpD family alkylhydroperoxidase